MTTIPQSNDRLDAKLLWARAYISLGWPTFVLGKNKQPVSLCDACRAADATHDRQACGCLLCHGFYAATFDIDRVALMIAQHPDGQLAVRTGAASDLIVLDFESGSDGSSLEVTGLDVLEQWEGWVGGWSLPDTVSARTESGGIHLFYSRRGHHVRQKIRPLPAMDVKAEGGYVAVPSGDGLRDWINSPLRRPPTPVSDELVGWLSQVKGGQQHNNRLGSRFSTSSGEPQGYNYLHAVENGPPVGMRDHFFNDMIFRSRKRGATMEETEEIALRIWEKLPQDGDPFLWDWVLYKIDRVYATVVAEASLSAIQQAWARIQETPHPITVTSGTAGYIKQGRVTIMPRERRMGL